MMWKRERHWAGALKAVLIPLAVLLVLLFFFTALHHLSDGRSEEARAQLETSLRRAAAACYAAEGAYPPTLEYLVERYGVQVDESRYTVFYDVFASNLMPDITVLDNAVWDDAL